MKQNPPIDSLPVEDVATIQAWIDYLRGESASPDIVSITIRLSDGETLYTIEKDAAQNDEE